MEVDVDAHSLNSNDVFVLKLPQNSGYIWIGKGASQEEEKGAEYVASVLKCKTLRIQEGEEPEEFWSSLEGKKSTRPPHYWRPRLKTIHLGFMAALTKLEDSLLKRFQESSPRMI